MLIRLFITLVLSNVWNFTYGQTDTNDVKFQYVDPVLVAKNFDLKYKQRLNQVKRAYPLALEAKRIIDELDTELESIEKRRKKKKATKETNKEIKEDFTFILKDLYVSEGAMLMKLIHRETGMTVDQIITKYKGKSRANVVRATFALYGHNTRSKYYPNGDDWITELVLQDIEDGKIQFDTKVQTVSKAQYKQGMKDYRQGIKDYRKGKRERKKKNRRNKKSSS